LKVIIIYILMLLPCLLFADVLDNDLLSKHSIEYSFPDYIEIIDQVSNNNDYVISFKNSNQKSEGILMFYSLLDEYKKYQSDLSSDSQVLFDFNSTFLNNSMDLLIKTSGNNKYNGKELNPTDFNFDQLDMYIVKNKNNKNKRKFKSMVMFALHKKNVANVYIIIFVKNIKRMSNTDIQNDLYGLLKNLKIQKRHITWLSRTITAPVWCHDPCLRKHRASPGS
jgi:hypothetical protein